MNYGNKLTEGNISTVLLRFSIPFLLANVLQALYGAVDLMVIGKYCGAEAIAAVSTGTQVTQIITSVISGLTLSATILVAKYVGQERKDMIIKTIGTTLTFFAIFSFLFMVVIFLNIQTILELLQIPASSYQEAYAYIWICTMGIFFICEYNALSAILRGYGDSLSPLLFVGIACVCNIIGDFYTVGYLHMGVAGTAVSTIVSQAISMFIAIWYLNTRGFIFHFSWNNLHMDTNVLKSICSIGIPVSFQECMVRFSFLYMISITNGFGVFPASAVGIANKYDVFAMLPATSIANALTALTAQNLAAGKTQRAHQFLRYGMGISFVCSLLFFAWAQISPQSMMQLFTNDPQVMAYGASFFRTCSFDYLAVSFLFCFNGYLNGCEKMTFTMMNCCGGALLIRVPLLYVFSKFHITNLFYYGMISPFSSVIMLMVIAMYFYSKRKVIKPRLNKVSVES